jgi:hypothetical protein
MPQSARHERGTPCAAGMIGPPAESRFPAEMTNKKKRQQHLIAGSLIVAHGYFRFSMVTKEFSYLLYFRLTV